MSAAAEAANPPDVEVLWGFCDGVSTPQPYGPFADMADALGAEFRRLLDGNASRGEVGRWLLKWMSAGPRRVLVIEDIHWADQATLDLLAVFPLPPRSAGGGGLFSGSVSGAEGDEHSHAPFGAQAL